MATLYPTHTATVALGHLTRVPEPGHAQVWGLLKQSLHAHMGVLKCWSCEANRGKPGTTGKVRVPSVVSLHWRMQHFTVKCLSRSIPRLQVGLASGLWSTVTLYFISFYATSFGDLELFFCVYSVFSVPTKFKEDRFQDQLILFLGGNVIVWM